MAAAGSVRSAVTRHAAGPSSVLERVEDERAGELAAAVGAGAVLASPPGPSLLIHSSAALVPQRSTRWSRKANCRSLRSVAAHSSIRKTSTISSEESGMTLPLKRKLPGIPIHREQLVAE